MTIRSKIQTRRVNSFIERLEKVKMILIREYIFYFYVKGDRLEFRVIVKPILDIIRDAWKDQIFSRDWILQRGIGDLLNYGPVLSLWLKSFWLVGFSFFYFFISLFSEENRFLSVSLSNLREIIEGYVGVPLSSRPRGLFVLNFLMGRSRRNLKPRFIPLH